MNRKNLLPITHHGRSAGDQGTGISAPTYSLQPTASSGWKAALDLRYEARATKTVLAHRSHTGPLLVQRPFYPEGNICHSYIVHPPGGVVGGDELTLDVSAQPGTHAVLTTPAAAKFYRSEGACAHQRQRLHAQDASLEWLPQETIYYPGARVRSMTRVQVTSASRFMGWEIACLGLPAREQCYDTGTLSLGLELWEDDIPRFIDRLHVSGGSEALVARWGWAGHQCLGTMLVWCARREWVERVRAIECTDAMLAFTLVDSVLVCRCLGQQAEPVRNALVQVRAVLRPELFGIPAVSPRIWAT